MATIASPAAAAGDVPEETLAATREAGLRWVSDRMPGIRRERRGGGFVYRRPDGSEATAPELDRIRALAIPPAWEDVWICPLASGHMQATGRDSRGRKVYRYHPRWREVRDADKFDRMLAFGAALPRLRSRVERDLGERGLTRDRVLATVVRLLDMTLIRVGHEEYARENGTFGLTTLRRRHVAVEGSSLRFVFRGKAGRMHRVTVRDRRVAAVVRRCQELPGQELFQYADDDGTLHSVGSDDVNGYIRDAAGEDFGTKDFRTWAATVLAATALREIGAPESAAEAKRQVVHTVEAVAAQLGNTPAVCRRCYIHPAVLEAHLDGRLHVQATRSPGGLSGDEAWVLAFLRRLQRRAA